MRQRWPKDTKFRELVLEMDQEKCKVCGKKLHVCAHRTRQFYTLTGPVRLCCQLAHCSDRTCPSRPATLSPKQELSLALPNWNVAWDVFAWIGHRRFVRHWSVPQICAELLDTYQITLSEDGVCNYVARYQSMVAARQQDPHRLALIYQDIPALILSIDGLQPEKGHETLYAVRELNAKLVWFAQPLLSSNQYEVRHLLTQARTWAERLNKPVQLWVSDKQDAFLKGIALEFPGVPHRYCANHFLRDLAKPMLAADSSAKVEMRSKIRGLRKIEEAATRHVRECEPQPDTKEQDAATNDAPREKANRTASREKPNQDDGSTAKRPKENLAQRRKEEAEVVLEYCACVRGILNDDQGGPLSPPGLRMARALKEVRASLGRNLELNLPGLGHRLLARLAKCIDRGLELVKKTQEEIKKQTEAVSKVSKTLDENTGMLSRRKKRYQQLAKAFAKKRDPFYCGMSKMMANWEIGLFVTVKSKAGEKLPIDNLELERWFRQPKRHERRIHGRKHAGVRIVQEGATLLPTLNAHENHPKPFTVEELLPYRDASPPPAQIQALLRRKTMRKARSKKNAQTC
jgi:hypothetical protein